MTPSQITKSSAASLATAILKKELAQLELVELPLSSEWGTLGMRQYASLGALLSHALSTWHEYFELVSDADLQATLQQRDLYARLSLKALPSQRQTELLDWAEAHMVLDFISRDGLLERFAAHSPASWGQLESLGRIALKCGCTEEAGYALLTDAPRLRDLVAQTATIASKLQRLLPWCINPAMAPAKCKGTRLRTEADAEEDHDRVRLVRVRFAGGAWSRELNWDEIAQTREMSPGRDPNAAARLMVPFG